MKTTSIRISATAIVAFAAAAGFSGCGKSGSGANAAAPTETALANETGAALVENEPGAEVVAKLSDEAVSDEVDPEAERKKAALESFERWQAAFAGGSATPQEEWKAVAEGLRPRVLVEGLEYLGAHTRVTGKDEYTFSLLFRAAKDLSTDYHFALDAYFSPSNTGALSKQAREKGVMKFHRRLLDDPTSQWKKGEYHVVDVKAAAPLIPYNLLLLGFSPSEDVFWNHVGTRLSLGWQWAPVDHAKFERAVAACDTPSALYAMAPDGPRLPPALDETVARKWSEFAQGTSPKPLTKGLDFLAARTEATGEREYTFSFLLKATEDLERDHIFTVIGEVDPSHLQHIKPSKPGLSYASWHIDLKHDPMPLWRKGTYHVAQLVIETELIPYNVSLWLSPRGDDGNWDWASKGNRIDLGWQADLRE